MIALAQAEHRRPRARDAYQGYNSSPEFAEDFKSGRGAFMKGDTQQEVVTTSVGKQNTRRAGYAARSRL